MAKMGFDPSKHSRWPIAFPVPLSPFSTGAFDSPINCLGVNRRWLNLIILASDVLLDERSWENPTEDELWYARQQLVLVQEALRRSEDCGEPQPPPVVSVETREDGCKRILLDGEPASDWICPAAQPEPDHVVGSSGLSYEELESFYMGCINVAAMIKVENGKIYAKDDCCNWVLVDGQEAPFVTTQTAEGNATSDWQGWDNAGNPPLPPQPEVQSSLDYFTNDSLRCAKATALLNALYGYLDTDKDIAAEAESGSFISDLISLAASYFTKVPPPTLTEYVATMKKHIAEMDVPAYADEVATIIANDDLKSQIICVLSDKVTAPGNIGLLKFNRVTDGDITALIDTFIEIAEPSSDFELRTKSVLVYWLAQKATADLDSVECGCEDLLPNGYTPPVPSGCFLATARPGGDLNGTSPVAGEATFEGTYAIGSGASWTSKLWSVIETINYDILSLIIEGNLDFNLSSVKVSYSTAVNYSGGGADDPVVAWLWRYDADDDEWVGGVVDGSMPDLGLTTQTLVSGTAERSAKWAVQLRAPGGAAQGRNVISAPLIQISGTATAEEDLGFVDLPLGEQVCL